MPKLQDNKRFIWIGSGVIGVLIILFIGFLMVKDLPGGYSDWRMSRSLDLQETLHIPLGKTPEEAVKKFRKTQMAQVIYHQPVKDGEFVLWKRFFGKEGGDLQLEYLRKNWLGWKWVWGGGYQIGLSLEDGAVLNYMSIPEVEHIRTPFPIVFGEALDPSIKSIIIKVNSTEPDEYPAVIFNDEHGYRYWFVQLPSSVSTPFEIAAYDEAGTLIRNRSINNPSDNGSI